MIIMHKVVPPILTFSIIFGLAIHTLGCCMADRPPPFKLTAILQVHSGEVYLRIPGYPR